jgi:hypothetical protein
MKSKRLLARCSKGKWPVTRQATLFLRQVIEMFIRDIGEINIKIHLI